MEQRLKISDITVGNRIRKDYGNLKGLAHSIKTVGLLQAIGVTQDGYNLIYGERRLKAVQLNGDSEIDCRILDIKDILAAEHAENEYRESLTLSEKHALAEELKKQAAKTERRGGKPGNKNASKTGKNENGQTGHNRSKQDQSKTTRSKIAIKAGFDSPQEMQRVATVMDKGSPELQEAMDKGDITVSAAAELATRTAKEQNGILEGFRGANGKVQVVRTQAALMIEKMEKLQEYIWGIEEKYKTVTDMMEHDWWKTSTKKEKKKAVQMVASAAKVLTRYAELLSAYAEQNL